MNAADSRTDNVVLYDRAIKGAEIAYGLARQMLADSISKFGPDQIVEYPDTAYELPIIYGWDGAEVKRLADLPPVLDRIGAMIQQERTLENGLAAGQVLMTSAEVIEALKYIGNSVPYEGTPFCGFIPDRVLRGLGLALVDDTIPGVVVLLGEAPEPEPLGRLVRDLQSKGMLIIAGNGIIRQLGELKIRTGLDLMLYPVGDVTQVVHALNFAVRAGLSFGGVQRGDWERLQAFLVKRLKAFILHFGPLDEVKTACGFAALLHGIPIITDQNVEGFPDKVIYQPDVSRMVQTGLEVRDIKVKASTLDLPVAYGPAFEGETVRRPDTFIEAGGAAKTMAYELLQARDEALVEDGKITVIGKDLDELPEGSVTPIAVLVDVYGKRM
ncbi:MAG TPA: hypothetical protein VLH13_00620, partial [Methanomassiliicoccales archaeon]|nr:hypothetical protein [Methanomassiliicoccales archaeon]